MLSIYLVDWFTINSIRSLELTNIENLVVSHSGCVLLKPNISTNHVFIGLSRFGAAALFALRLSQSVHAL